MPCEKCTEQPGYHSFNKFGTLNDLTLFYTSPAKTKDFDLDGTKLSNILIDIKSQTDKPWGWIVDCRNMGFSHYTDFKFNMGILHHLSNDENIVSVWILYPNVWVQTTLYCLKNLFNSTIYSKIHFLEGSNIELLESMKKMGFKIKDID